MNPVDQSNGALTLSHARGLLRRIGIGGVLAALASSGLWAAPVGATTPSPWIGSYTGHERLGTFATTVHLTIGPHGVASDGSVDIASWSASRGVITISIGNSSGEVIVEKGHLTHFGIASAAHPGTARLYIGGSLALTGTFYAQRTS